MRTLCAATGALAVCLFALAPRSFIVAGPPADRPHHTLRLGISSSLFQGMPEPIVVALMKPFEGLLIEQTGMNGELISSGDGTGVAQGLVDGKIDIGVLEGIEFAWARQKHPELRPLMITINQHKDLHACVVVRTDSPAQRFSDLKSQPVELFRNCREHCRLFLKHLCQEQRQTPEQFFSKVNLIDNAEAVLDDVVDNAVAAVVDNVFLDSYRRRKPARFAQLRIISTSPTFPASVIAFRDGTLDDATKTRFQQGMLKANKSTIGKQLLTLWKLSAFEMVPDDYEQILAHIVKVFPAPAKQARPDSDKVGE